MTFASPATDSAIGNASSWALSLTSGSIAASLAVLAVAGVGFAMLTGRLRIRNGGTVLIGCFVLFGSAVLAQSLLEFAEGSRNNQVPQAQADLFMPPPPALEPPKRQLSVDPYAGAALPN